MDNKSEEETNHVVTNHGVDVDADNKTQEGTPLFDTLCLAAAVVTLSPQTNNNVASPGTPHSLSATIDARDTPHLLDFHHSVLGTITLPPANRRICKPEISDKQKEHMSSVNKHQQKCFVKKNFTFDAKTIIKELRDNVPTVGLTDLCHLSKVVFNCFNY